MKIEIERVSKVYTPLVIDTQKIDYEKLMEDFEMEGIECDEDLDSKNFENFLSENESQIDHIFYVLSQYGYAKLGKDKFSDDSHYYIKSLP